MAKAKVPSVIEIEKELKKGDLKPVYYIFGEDSYGFDSAKELIEKKAGALISSDFDKENYYGENKSFNEIISAASTFPFGTGKKLIIYKQAEKARDKKELAVYANSPSEFTILVCFHDGSISSVESEPFKSLKAKGFIYESKELKGSALVEWLIAQTELNGKKLSEENAQVMIDIVGENRGLIEAQLDKIFTYLAEKKEVTLEVIQALSTELKQFSIFDLQNAIGKKDKATAMRVAFNLLDNGTEPVVFVAMLNRYFTGLAKIGEMMANRVPEKEAARIVGTHPYYYKNYVDAKKRYSDENIADAFRALLKADLSIKSTSLEEKTVISLLIAEIIPD